MVALGHRADVADFVRTQGLVWLYLKEQPAAGHLGETTSRTMILWMGMGIYGWRREGWGGEEGLLRGHQGGHGGAAARPPPPDNNNDGETKKYKVDLTLIKWYIVTIAVSLGAGCIAASVIVLFEARKLNTQRSTSHEADGLPNGQLTKGILTVNRWAAGPVMVGTVTMIVEAVTIFTFWSFFKSRDKLWEMNFGLWPVFAMGLIAAIFGASSMCET